MKASNGPSAEQVYGEIRGEERERRKGTRSKGKYKAKEIVLACNVGNALLALQTEPELKGTFGYDEMLRTEVLLRPLLCDDPNFKIRPVTDADVTAVQTHLQWFGFCRLGKDTTHQAVDKVAREHSFHPLHDYLNGLEWDGNERLPEWLPTYLGTEKNEYIKGIGTMFLIGMVARVLRPGCKMVHAGARGRAGQVQIIGLQRLGRRLFLRSLAQPEQQRRQPASARQMADRSRRAPRLFARRDR
jgi:hypothetical protein